MKNKLYVLGLCLAGLFGSMQASSDMITVSVDDEVTGGMVFKCGLYYKDKNGLALAPNTSIMKIGKGTGTDYQKSITVPRPVKMSGRDRYLYVSGNTALVFPATITAPTDINNFESKTVKINIGTTTLGVLTGALTGPKFLVGHDQYGKAAVKDIGK